MAKREKLTRAQKIALGKNVDQHRPSGRSRYATRHLDIPDRGEQKREERKKESQFKIPVIQPRSVEEVSAEIGTSAHFCAAIFAEVLDDGTVMFGYIRYEITYFRNGLETGNSVQFKFPGGTNRGFPEQTIGETFVRELAEEVGRFLTYRSEEVYKFVPPEGDNGSSHSQHFFLVQDAKGEYRKGDLEDVQDSTTRMGESQTEKISELMWTDALHLLGFIFTNPKKGNMGHHHALIASLRRLAKEYPKVTWKYADFLESF